MYKLAVVLVFAIIVKNITAISDEQKTKVQAKFLEFGADCIKEHPISSDDVASFKEKKFPGGENAGCFIGCVFKKAGIIDDKGLVSQADAVAKAKEVFTEEEDIKNVEEFLNICSKVNNEDASDGEKGCDRAAMTYKCLVENSDKFGFNIDF